MGCSPRGRRESDTTDAAASLCGVLVSVVQAEPAVRAHTSLVPGFPSRLGQRSAEQSLVRPTRFCLVSVVFTLSAACTCPSQRPSSPRSLPAGHPYACPLRPHLFLLRKHCLPLRSTAAPVAQWRSRSQCGRGRFDPSVEKIPWRRKWPPVPALLPGDPCGQRGLAGYRVHGVPKGQT